MLALFNVALEHDRDTVSLLVVNYNNLGAKDRVKTLLTQVIVVQIHSKASH